MVWAWAREGKGLDTMRNTVPLADMSLMCSGLCGLGLLNRNLLGLGGGPSKVLLRFVKTYAFPVFSLPPTCELRCELSALPTSMLLFLHYGLLSSETVSQMKCILL